MISFSSGNQIKLLRNGAEYFPALETAIEHAQHEIHLQTYIYQHDNIGTRIGEALKRAAQRGVWVHILLDGFGSKDLAPSYVKTLEDSGVMVMFYRPKISPWTFKKNRLRRMHRKVCVIDQTIAFVGGINIIDDYNVPKNMPPRIDYAVCIQGQLLPVILSSVTKLWRRISVLHLQSAHLKTTSTFTSTDASFLKSSDSTESNPDLTLIFDEKIAANHQRHSLETHSNVKAAFILRDNVLNRRSIENAYLSAIKQAQTEIIIANAYFVPGRRFRRALLAAARRGVSVQLLLQGRMEYFLMFATHAFYAVFLKHNVQIYEYRTAYMHSKVAVIDGEWATVGSSNIDPFSLFLAREANVVVKDKRFASELRNDVMQVIENNAYHVQASEWSNRHLFKRLLSWLAYGLVRVFVGLIGFAKHQ